MFPYVIQYKQGKDNVEADALSGRYVLLSTLSAKFLGFEHIKELHLNDFDFSIVFDACELFIPKCSLCKLLVRESHGRGLVGHFGIPKTLEILKELFFSGHKLKMILGEFVIDV